MSVSEDSRYRLQSSPFTSCEKSDKLLKRGGEINQIGILSLAVALLALSGEIAARKATIPAAFRGTRAKERPAAVVS
jgi:hypothetical protein